MHSKFAETDIILPFISLEISTISLPNIVEDLFETKQPFFAEVFPDSNTSELMIEFSWKHSRFFKKYLVLPSFLATKTVLFTFPNTFASIAWQIVGPAF